MVPGPHDASSRLQENTVVIVAYSWADGSPRLRIRPVRGPSELVDAVGFSINYRVEPDARFHCPGRVPFRAGQGDYLDCFNPPQRGSRTCVSCAVAEATLAGSLHHAHTRDPDELDTDVAAHLLQPNLLYLAAFRDGSIKVGTSSTQRATTRWMEQGAWMAATVAEAIDGIVVRRLEDLVTEELAVPQSVGVGRKRAGLASPVPDDTVAESLKQTVGDVHRLVARSGLPGVDTTEEFWSNPLVGSIEADELRPYPADIRRDSHHFTIEAMAGRLAIITRNLGLGSSGGNAGVVDRFIIDIGQLIGLELHLGQFEPVEVAVQDSLF